MLTSQKSHNLGDLRSMEKHKKEKQTIGIVGFIAD
jgi:hypothetical protein